IEFWEKSSSGLNRSHISFYFCNTNFPQVLQSSNSSIVKKNLNNISSGYALYRTQRSFYRSSQ
ncbi:hypothetical protein GIB67_035813, partial [Kingdonia uniflora]